MQRLGEITIVVGGACSKATFPSTLEDIAYDWSPAGRATNNHMSAWDPEDLEKADETIAKVAALGWVQRDVRGSNFVRLRNGEKYWIAMIDFESVEEVEK